MALSLLRNLSAFSSPTLQSIGRQFARPTTGTGKTSIFYGLPALAVSGSTAFEQRRNYAMRLPLSEHGIKWRRPTYIESWKPEKSGDLQSLDDPDPSRPPLKLDVVRDEFEKLDEDTKNYLSLKYAPRSEVMKVVYHDKIKEVQRHRYDTNSMEVRVAKLTVKIRNLQKVVAKDRRFTFGKCRLNELIAKRKKMLKYLRKSDYKRFEWLLERLDLHYKPFPTAYHWITRKDSLRKLVQMHKDEIINNRLEEYKQVLKSQEKEFLKEKEETLKWIAETEAELGISSSTDSKEST